jgi:hypothetical protein
MLSRDCSVQSIDTGSPHTPNSVRQFNMAETAYLVRFKKADLSPELVIAETIEFQGEHLVFLRSDRSLVALVLLEIVESWSEVKL